MLDAIHPLREALVTPMSLRHKDGGVSLMVATCISAIIKISTLDVPYEDDVMRDAFQLIIYTFLGLGNIHSLLFGKRVTLLEKMEKFESCVVMWDIGCHDLILEMFHIFFFVVLEAHPINVINSMQSIMTLMMDESDDIPESLMAVIRASLGGGEKGVSSAGHRLSMYVMEHCANRLEPYSTIPPDDISTCDGQEDSSSDHEEEITSSSCDEIQDDLGVDLCDEDGMITTLDTPS